MQDPFEVMFVKVKAHFIDLGTYPSSTLLRGTPCLLPFCLEGAAVFHLHFPVTGAPRLVILALFLALS